MHWDISLVLGFIGGFGSFNIRSSFPSDPAEIDYFPACIPMAIIHGLALFIQFAQSAGVVQSTNCGKTHPTSVLDTTDGEAPVLLELWGMQNTLLLPSLPGPLCPWVVAPDRVLSMGQIELNWIVWN